jgi:hypothetical protein
MAATMKLFKLERTFAFIYDEAIGMVIRAADETQARRIATRHAMSEGASEWEAGKADCEEIGISHSQKPGLVLIDSVKG